MSETKFVKGEVTINIIDAKTGKIKETHEFTNILVDTGRKMHRNWAASIAPATDPNYNVDTHISHIAVGDDNTAVAQTQTSLGNELLKKEVYPTPNAGCGITLVNNETVQYEMLINTSELNGETIRELCLISETFTNFMVSRLLCGNLAKTSDVQFLIKYRFVYG